MLRMLRFSRAGVSVIDLLPAASCEVLLSDVEMICAHRLRVWDDSETS